MVSFRQPSAVMVPLLTLVAHDPLASISADVPGNVATPWYQSTGAVAGVSEADESTGMALEKVAATARLRTVLKKRMVFVGLGWLEVLKFGLKTQNWLSRCNSGD